MPLSLALVVNHLPVSSRTLLKCTPSRHHHTNNFLHLPSSSCPHTPLLNHVVDFHRHLRQQRHQWEQMAIILTTARCRNGPARFQLTKSGAWRGLILIVAKLLPLPPQRRPPTTTERMRKSPNEWWHFCSFAWWHLSYATSFNNINNGSFNNNCRGDIQYYLRKQ